MSAGMRWIGDRAIAALAGLLIGVAGAAAQGAPEAADLLFERPQWREAAPATLLVYRYRRATPFEQAFGPNFEDRIRLTLEDSATPDARTVRVEMFSEGRRQAAGPFEDVTGNPVLVLFLEHHLETLVRVLNANPRYLKNAIRAALRDKATVLPTDVEWRGQSRPGWRIEVRPFVEDAYKDRMRGLESLTYSFVTSDAVPGAIVSIKAEATTVDGDPLLLETLTHDQSGD
jgi:hypothetical protein